jgi:hypothetical protein
VEEVCEDIRKKLREVKIRVEVSGRAGIGEVVLFGRSQGGLGVRQSAIDGTGPGLGRGAARGVGEGGVG